MLSRLRTPQHHRAQAAKIACRNAHGAPMELCAGRARPTCVSSGRRRRRRWSDSMNPAGGAPNRELPVGRRTVRRAPLELGDASFSRKRIAPGEARMRLRHAPPSGMPADACAGMQALAPYGSERASTGVRPIPGSRGCRVTSYGYGRADRDSSLPRRMREQSHLQSIDADQCCAAQKKRWLPSSDAAVVAEVKRFGSFMTNRRRE